MKDWFLKIKKIVLLIIVFATMIGVLSFGAGNVQDTAQQKNQLSGGSFEDATWRVFKSFQGFKTKPDASKLSEGASPNGQNTIINDGDRISIRPFGSTVLGTSTTTAHGIVSLYTFRKRSGENILIRFYNQNLEYFEEGNDTWESMVTSSYYTANKPFGFADYNINTDQRSYTYFGNGDQPFARWSGAHTLTSGAVGSGATSITVDDTTDFPASGAIRYCDQNLAYTSKTATTFVVNSTHSCDDNRGVSLVIDEYPTNPRGNILLNASNRIFVAGVTSTPQAVYFSQYGVATNFLGATLVATSTAASPGIFNFGEGGGAVTGAALDEGAIYFFKKSIIYKATLSDSLYNLQPLKPFDGKSQTTGATNPNMVFAGGNGIFFSTPDNQLMNLTRIEGVDYPQMLPISDEIKPTVDSMIMASSTGISWKDKAYFATKTDNNSLANDVVLLFNERLNVWESPIVGWTVGAWAIYDNGTGEALYFGDGLIANVYKVSDGALDNELGVTANWRSKKYDFEHPEILKEIDDVYVEGYISDNTTLNISLLYDDDGFTQTYAATFRGTETDYLFNANPFNLFGYHPVGFERFGSSQQSNKKKFRVYLNKNLRLTPFYNAQIEFSSDGESQDWEVTSYGFHVRNSSQPERRTLYRNFN